MQEKKNITDERTTGKSIVINGGSERKNGKKIMCKLAAVVINVLCPPNKIMEKGSSFLTPHHPFYRI